MPLYTSFTVAKNTQVLVWKITESYNELFRAVQLKDFCMARLEGMRSESHQRGFLSVRMLLQTAGYTDFDLYYNDDGKPHLKAAGKKKDLNEKDRRGIIEVSPW